MRNEEWAETGGRIHTQVTGPLRPSIPLSPVCPALWSVLALAGPPYPLPMEERGGLAQEGL